MPTGANGSIALAAIGPFAPVGNFFFGNKRNQRKKRKKKSKKKWEKKPSLNNANRGKWLHRSRCDKFICPCWHCLDLVKKKEKKPKKTKNNPISFQFNFLFCLLAVEISLVRNDSVGKEKGKSITSIGSSFILVDFLFFLENLIEIFFFKKKTKSGLRQQGQMAPSHRLR
jgi:hypothetical protein